MKNQNNLNPIDNQKLEIVSKENSFRVEDPIVRKIQQEPCVFSYQHLPSTELMNRFVNFLTKKGKKSKAQSIFSKTLYILMKKIQQELTGGSLRQNQGISSSQINRTGDNSLLSAENISTIFHKSIQNVIPFFEVKKVRVAGTTYLVPSLIQSHRQEKLAINWIIESAFSRKKKNPKLSFENCLAIEFYEAFLRQGQARNKRNELHKLAEAQRAFSHFRWW